MLSLTECGSDFQNDALWDTHRLIHHLPSVTLAVVALQRINTSRVTITPSYTQITFQHIWASLVRERCILSQFYSITCVDE